jgi:hypothetical protein
VSAVEFVDDAPDGTHDPPPRRGRSWWLLGVAVLGAVALSWALTRPVEPASRKPQAAPSATSSSGESASRKPQAAPSATSSSGESTCRGAPACTRTSRIPQPLRRVIDRYLPQAASIEVRSYLAQRAGVSYLAEREIDVVIGSVSVLIAVRRDLDTRRRPSAIVTAPPGVGSVLVHSEPEGFAVDLQYLAPETVPPTLSRLRMLARDPALEAL